MLKYLSYITVVIAALLLASCSSQSEDNPAEKQTTSSESQALKSEPLIVDSSAKYGLGRPALPTEVAAWDIDVLPDGRGLPNGSGDAIVGEEVFAAKCASCHGDFAEGVDNWPSLAGGFDTLADKDPVKTVGSYWPHLSTVWDYINRSMPFGAAQTLTADEVYAITAYILYSNDLIEDDYVLSHENFADFKMHNKDGFIFDDRETTEYPLWKSEPCMKDCKETVEVTMRASVIDVTPEEENADNKENTQVVATPVSGLNQELVSAGKKEFAFCKVCHQVGANAKNGIGPHLNNVFDRKIGGLSDYKYSKVFQEANSQGRAWDDETMAAFLENPLTYMAGTKMGFGGVKDEQKLTALIEYLRSLDE